MARRHAQQVSGWLGQDDLVQGARRPGRLEGASKIRDEFAHCSHGLGRRMVAPHGRDQLVDRDHPIRVEHEGGKRHPLARTTDHDRSARDPRPRADRGLENPGRAPARLVPRRRGAAGIRFAGPGRILGRRARVARSRAGDTHRAPAMPRRSAIRRGPTRRFVRTAASDRRERAPGPARIDVSPTLGSCHPPPGPRRYARPSAH